MSLFPAYKSDVSKETDKEELEWLKNDTCPPQTHQVLKHDLSEFPSTSKKTGEDTLEVKTVPVAQRIIRTSLQLEHTDNIKSLNKSYHKDRSTPSLDQVNSKKRKKEELHSRLHKTKKKKKHDIDDIFKRSKFLASVKSVFLEDCGSSIKPEEAFFVSAKKDQSNLGLKATHYSEKSRYSSLRTLLGHTFKPKTQIVKRYFSKSNKKAMLMDGQFISTVNQVECTPNVSTYIPLAMPYSKNLQTITTPVVESSCKGNEGNATYLCKQPLHGQNAEFVTNSEAHYWQHKMKVFNEKLSKSPNDIDLWLEFVRVQDKAFTYMFDNNTEETSRKKREHRNSKMLVERKISILDSAIRKNPRAVALYLERLQHGKDLWDNAFLKSEWVELVCQFPNEMAIWQKYLVFCQTHFPIFDMDEMSSAFAMSVKKIARLWTTGFESQSIHNIGQYLIDISVQLAHAWYQGGYIEKSIALMQALIEINFFCPHNIEALELADRIDVFEAFWDSKAPRFGERKAVGWATFMKNKTPVEFPDEIIGGTKDEEDEILEDRRSIADMWIRLESSRELHHWLPWQQDPDDCEDTERMVEFEVLREHIFLLHSQHDREYLLQSFINFLAETTSTQHARTPNARVFDTLRLETLSSFTSSTDFDNSKPTNPFMFPIIGPSIVKKESEKYFQFTCESVRQAITLCTSATKKFFVICLIELLAARFAALQPHPTAAQHFAKASKKEIKAYLKMAEFRTDPDMYSAFADYQLLVSGYGEALKVHCMALSLALQTIESLSDNITLSLSLMKHLKCVTKIRLQQETIDRNRQQADPTIAGICSFYSNLQYTTTDMPSTATLLKVRHQLDNLVMSSCEELKNQQPVDVILGYNLFFKCVLYLLTSGVKAASLIIDESLQFFDTLIQSADEASVVVRLKENLYVEYLWLLELAPKLNHIQPCPPLAPTQLRALLADSIAVAPHNPTFLKYFAENQTWRDHLGFNSSPTLKSQSVVHIIHRLLPLIEKTKLLVDQTDMGNFSCGHQIEHILESAVKSPECMSCPLLWRLYLRCVSLVRPKGLKDLVYRAINNCPGAKCIYLDCVQMVPDMLNEITRLMEEKKMRIRLPLEELHVLLEDELDEEESPGEPIHVQPDDQDACPYQTNIE